jgi:hypothetical protein
MQTPGSAQDCSVAVVVQRFVPQQASHCGYKMVQQCVRSVGQALLMALGIQCVVLVATDLGGAEILVAECGRLVGVEGVAEHYVAVVAYGGGAPLLPVEVRWRA